jgi:hypothetical protein
VKSLLMLSSGDEEMLRELQEIKDAGVQPQARQACADRRGRVELS